MALKNKLQRLEELCSSQEPKGIGDLVVTLIGTDGMPGELHRVMMRLPNGSFEMVFERVGEVVYA